MEEVLSYLDQLQRTIEAKFKIPLTEIIIVNQDELLEVVKDLQENIPEALIYCQQVKKDETAIIEEAKKEVGEINRQILEFKKNKISKNPNFQIKKEEATQILSKAKKLENEEIKETETFANSILDNIEKTAQEHLTNLRKARLILQQKKLAPPSSIAEEIFEQEKEDE